MRDGVRYISKALLIVFGVRPDGYREIFTFSVADAEHELTWEGIFSNLKERRLNKVDLIISDSHNGISAAAGKMFPGPSWQMCHVHFICAVIMKVPRKYHKEITETLKEFDCKSLPFNSMNVEFLVQMIRFAGSSMA